MTDPIRERIDWLDDDDRAAPLADALRAVMAQVDLTLALSDNADCRRYAAFLRELVIEALGSSPKIAPPDYMPAHQFLGDEGKRCWWKNANGYMCCLGATSPVHE